MIQKGVIDGKKVDVISFDEYTKHPEMYEPGYTAVNPNNGYIYPIRSKTDTRPGIYQHSELIYKYKNPENDEKDRYSESNVIDFSKPATVGELIKKQQSLKAQERTILTNADNIFQPEIKDGDYPAMIALKTAVNKKQININSYEHRFGSNFNNDIRLFEKHNITLTKLVSMCDALDITASLTLKDNNSDVPNPIGDTIEVDLTSIGEGNNG